MSSDREDSDRREPTVDQPLNAKPRPRVLPVVLLIAFIVVVLAVLLLGPELLSSQD